MNTCAVSFKECWQDDTGAWLSDGGFPLQMAGLGSLFDEMTLAVVAVPPRSGGLPLPAGANIVSLRRPAGHGALRKVSVVLHLPYYVRTIARAIRCSDVVQIPLPGDLPFIALLIGLACGKDLTVRYEGAWQINSQTTLMNRVTRALLRLISKRHVVLATGAGDCAPGKHISWMFATALTTHELEQIRPITRSGLLDPPRLVYVGRLSPEKGVEYLVNAIAELQADGFRPLPRVTLIGDGPSRLVLESLVDHFGCRERIRFAGQLDRRRMSQELLQADFCVLPSLSEGYSKAALDAMAHGLPVIFSDVGAARAIAGADGERGWVVPSADSGQIAAAVRRVITQPADWTGIRGRCRAYAEVRTLDSWRDQVAQRCADKWGLSIENGRFRRLVPNAPPVGGTGPAGFDAR